MNEPLLPPITKRFADRSTRRTFAFGFYCDRCGKEWRSVPRAFRCGGTRSYWDLRVLRMMWNGQYKEAYERANLDAIYSFAYCPKCGRRVCMECYCRSETDAGEVCEECLSKKKEENQDVCGRETGIVPENGRLFS